MRNAFIFTLRSFKYKKIIGKILKVLVTGATGFVGSHVADKLIEKGYEVKCIARKTSNLRWLENKPVEIIETSLNDKEKLKKAVEGVDYIYHIAGLVFAKDYDEFLKGNRDATKNIIEACAEVNPNLKRFLFVSSQTVCGPSPSLENPIDENYICKPLTSYGKSKKAAEDEVLKFKGTIPFTIVRAPAVYGPRDTATYDVFKLVKKGFGTLIGLNPKYVSLIHSDDLARGIIQAAESDRSIDQTYFVSSEKFYNWDEIIAAMAAGFGKKSVMKIKIPHAIVLSLAWISEQFGKLSSKPPVFNYEKGIDFIQDYWICSTQKAINDFGFQQKMSLENGMKDTINWYINNKWL